MLSIRVHRESIPELGGGLIRTTGCIKAARSLAVVVAGVGPEGELWLARPLLSVHLEISCPSAGSGLSAYLESGVSAVTRRVG